MSGSRVRFSQVDDFDFPQLAPPPPSSARRERAVSDAWPSIYPAPVSYQDQPSIHPNLQQQTQNYPQTFAPRAPFSVDVGPMNENASDMGPVRRGPDSHTRSSQQYRHQPREIPSGSEPYSHYNDNEDQQDQQCTDDRRDSDTTLYDNGEYTQEKGKDHAQNDGSRDSLEKPHYLVSDNSDLEAGQPPRPGTLERIVAGYEHFCHRPSFKRFDSCKSTGSAVLDDDDPRVTGMQPNRIDQEKATLLSSRRPSTIITRNVEAEVHRQRFIIKLSKALMLFGAPAHRIEAQLAATARILEITADFVHLPGVVIIAFGDHDHGNSSTQFIKSKGGFALSALDETQRIYKLVTHDEIGAEEGSRALTTILRAPPIYGTWTRCFIAFLCAAIITPLAFEGSVIDAIAAGLCGLMLASLNLRGTSKSQAFSDVFEITIAVMVSFIARALNSINGHIFCYSAIASGGIVLILPGFIALSGALELASKNILSGSIKMVHAIVYALFLGFSQTIGSDLLFFVSPATKRAREAMSIDLARSIVRNGTFNAINGTIPTTFVATFITPHAIDDNTPIEKYHYQVKGCYRSPDWPWYMQPAPWQTLFFLVPLFASTLALWNLQRLKSKKLVIMVAIACCSFAANKGATSLFLNHSDIVSTTGAFVVGLLGNIYSRVCGGTAFTAMVPGVLVLVPSGLTVVGGLSRNYVGSSNSNSQYYNGLQIALGMVQVGVGITVGLFTASFLVYSINFFPGKKRREKALFAF